MITIREFDAEKDLKEVEEMEMRCDVGPAAPAKNDKGNKKKKCMSLHVDLLGDPLCRVRHTRDHVMLVAEYGEEEKEMVGVIRACIKMVKRGSTVGPTYTKVAYILGLRVSPTHRRLGIGIELARTAESWCVRKGAEYSYVATDGSNVPSLNLFTRRLSYVPFRSLAILTQPVHSHPLRIPSSVSLLRIPPSLSSPLYRTLFASADFFPSDISSLLSHPSTVGTFLAVPASSKFDPTTNLPSSFAIMSLWNSKHTFRLRVCGATKCARRFVRWTRAIDRRAHWLKVPSLHDVFSPFGVHLMYGLRMGGKGGKGLMRWLCRFAHNVAMEDEECAAVVAEVAKGDPVRRAVPHWRRFSCEEDLWCAKRLVADDDGGDGGDWTKCARSDEVVFVDPREF